ncbi:MAG: FGGY-family carbohydrate kinase [Promicromonosporaceae bacterium]|nr:FGGY-family carbohydrate kinase [Promicromonosporaceae bacterium]
MALVAGVDSSTQSCKIVIRDSETGKLVRSGSAKHPEGTEVNPQAWWDAFLEAANAAGGLDDVAALSVGGQQHGMVVLDENGAVIRPALLWNDTRSAAAAEELIAELGTAKAAAGTDDFSQVYGAGDTIEAGEEDSPKFDGAGPIGGYENQAIARSGLRYIDDDATGTGQSGTAGNRQRGADEFARIVGSVPVASLTVTKLRWLADNEPDKAHRVAAVALPHDWLSWRIAGYGPHGDPDAPKGPKLDKLFTDKSDASGTGYYDAEADGGKGAYRFDLLGMALKKAPSECAPAASDNSHCKCGVVLPRVLAPTEVGAIANPDIAGSDVPGGCLIGPGAGDNAGAAIGLGMKPGDIAISIGTSGVVSAVAPHRTADGTGAINGFADATGNALMLAVTLNAAQVLDAARHVLGADFRKLSDLALHAPTGSDGLVLVPYLAGERTPNRPDATGTLHGITLKNMTPEHIARAYIEGMLSGLADGLDALRAQDVPIENVMLIGGAAQSPAVQEIATQVFGLPISIPEPGEYVADGAARQAAWVLDSAKLGHAAPQPAWATKMSKTLAANPKPLVREQYAKVRDLV